MNVIMFAQFSLILVLTALLALGGAHPGGHHDHSSSEEHHHGGEKQHNHGKGHKHDKGNEHQHHGEGPYGGGGMEVKINQNTPFMKTKNLTEDLYNEIFVIASGENYASPELPNDVHINARAAVLTSQKLHAMKEVYPIFSNLTVEYALKGAKLEDKQTVVDLISDLTAQVKSKCPDFEVVKNSVTDSFITRGKHFKSGATSQEKAEAYDKWMYEPFVGIASMNKLFYFALLKDDRPQYEILRAMVKNAGHENPARENLEKIYASVIAKTVEKVCPTHEPRKAALIFYQYLMDVLAEDAPLLVSLYSENNILAMINKPF